jgi:hypothetical protein
MRMKTVQTIRIVTRWVQRILEVRLPLGTVFGLHTGARR